jgi:asparagine synthase (glutamine-hydrolysing)
VHGFVALIAWAGHADQEMIERMVDAFVDTASSRREHWTLWATGEAAMACSPLGHDAQRFTATSSIAVIVDGQLDNREELRLRLGLGPEERQAPDSAYLTWAYQHWGSEAPRYLVGNFVFVLWDQRNRKLLCSTDHGAYRPLFYHLSEAGIAISSAPRGLLALPHVPKRLDEQAFADFLILIGRADTSFFEGVHRLPPAHTLTASPAGVRIAEYWSMTSIPQAKYSSDEECLEHFRTVFAEAVACRLPGSSPVGAFLSGGLDSSAVACSAARALAKCGRQLTTFTAMPRTGFVTNENPRWYGDDRPYIEAICDAHPNINAVLVQTDGLTSLTGLNGTLNLAEAPVRNPANRVWIEAILTNAASRGIRVMLHGQDGNSWISYDGVSRLRALARAGAFRTLIHEVRAFAQQRGRSPLRLLKTVVLGPLIPDPIWAMRQRWSMGSEPWSAWSPVNPEFARRMHLRARLLSAPEGRLKNPVRHAHEHRVALANAGAVHLARDLYSAYRAAFGVEMRDPTADRRIIEFCLALPDEQYFRGGHDRLLVRRGMRGIVPELVLSNVRRGMQGADWYERLSLARTAILNEIELLERSAAAREYLDVPKMRRLVEHWPEGGWNRREIINSYGSLLERGIVAGRFIRLLEERHLI